MVYYADYLQLDKILDAQALESAKHGSPAHEELLFIVTHQAFELWFKQVLAEVTSVITMLDADYVAEADLALCLHRLRRVNRIMELLCDQFTILETMTPSEFMDFRAFLNPASGFQSMQWRILERTMGLAQDRRVLQHYTDALREEHRMELERATSGPTLFDVVTRWLEKIPFMHTSDYAFWTEYRTAVHRMLENDRAEVRVLAEAEQRDPAAALRQIDANQAGFDALFEADRYAELLASGSRRMSQTATLAVLFISTYQRYPLLQIPYQFLDAIVEFDRLVSVWRYRHTMMVSRMIGMRVGTGGSSGHDYLMKTTMLQRVFDDITSLSSYLVPSSVAPHLPQEIATKLQFVNESS